MYYKNLSFIFVFFFLCFSQLAFTQDEVEREINLLMTKENYKLKSSQFGRLSEGDAMFKGFQFSNENEYIILAYGESGVIDVDIKVIDKKNMELVKDKASEALATVKFTPLESEYLKVIIENYNSEARNHTYMIKYFIFYKPK